MNPTVLVTGASGGIGSAIATRFAREGYRVAIHYNHHREKAEQLVQELRNQNPLVIAVQADISNEQQVKNMMEEVTQQLGGIDILINNAGFAQQKLFTDITSDEWKKMFDVHVNGAFYCIQAVLPWMIHNKKGKIINISSMWGQVGASCEVHYSAAKAALIGMTKALAKELGLSGIQVNCVSPGVIKTKMNHMLGVDVLEELKEETPLNKLGTPDDIANAVYFLASDQADFITGQVLASNGGYII